MKQLLTVIIGIAYTLTVYSQSSHFADSIYSQVATNLVSLDIKKTPSPSQASLLFFEVFINENGSVADIKSWNKEQTLPINNIQLLFKGINERWLQTYKNKHLVFPIFILNQTNGNEQSNNIYFLNDINLDYINRISTNKPMMLMKPIIVNTIDDIE